jgi:hypothetical protein
MLWDQGCTVGKVEIPTSDVIDEKTEEGKRLLRTTDLNEIAFSELILSKLNLQFERLATKQNDNFGGEISIIHFAIQRQMQELG